MGPNAHTLRRGGISPVDKGLPVAQAPPRERAVRGRHLREVAVADLVEAAGLDHRDGARLLLGQARGEREARVAASDYHVVVGDVVARDAE